MEALMAVIGVISAVEVVPQIARIIRRKSSDDISIVSLLLGIFFQVCWVVYGVFHQLPALIIAAGVWTALIVATLGVTLYFRGKSV